LFVRLPDEMKTNDSIYFRLGTYVCMQYVLDKKVSFHRVTKG